MGLLEDLRSLKSLHLDAGSDLETAAYLVAKSEDEATQRKAVETGVRWVRQGTDASANEFVAWLFVYKVVSSLQVLQAIVYTGDTTVVRICGTGRFEKDSIQHLQLEESEGVSPRYDVTEKDACILVDFLSVETNPTSDQMDSRKEPGRQNSGASALAKKSQEDELMAYRGRVRGIIMGSMSAEEMAHKLLSVTPKKWGAEAIDTLVQVCMDEKAYNRLYGNVSYRLSRHSVHWSTLLQAKFGAIFGETSEELNVNQLKVVGTFYGHLLEVNAVNWPSVVSVMSLDPEQSTASNRILLQALMLELKQGMGMAKLEKRLTGPDMKEATEAIFSGEFAAQFWEIIGLPDLAKHVVVDEPISDESVDESPE